jgi:ribose 1,5-bisphosphokinase PhnN
MNKVISRKLSSGEVHNVLALQNISQETLKKCFVSTWHWKSIYYGKHVVRMNRAVGAHQMIISDMGRYSMLI